MDKFNLKIRLMGVTLEQILEADTFIPRALAKVLKDPTKTVSIGVSNKRRNARNSMILEVLNEKEKT